jgi:hypothetical protein
MLIFFIIVSHSAFTAPASLYQVLHLTISMYIYESYFSERTHLYLQISRESLIFLGFSLIKDIISQSWLTNRKSVRKPFVFLYNQLGHSLLETSRFIFYFLEWNRPFTNVILFNRCSNVKLVYGFLHYHKVTFKSEGSLSCYFCQKKKQPGKTNISPTRTFLFGLGLSS